MKKRVIDRFKTGRNKGITLIEIGAALVVVGLISASLAMQLAEYTQQRRAVTSC